MLNSVLLMSRLSLLKCLLFSYLSSSLKNRPIRVNNVDALDECRSSAPAPDFEISYTNPVSLVAFLGNISSHK